MGIWDSTNHRVNTLLDMFPQMEETFPNPDGKRHERRQGPFGNATIFLAWKPEFRPPDWPEGSPVFQDIMALIAPQMSYLGPVGKWVNMGLQSFAPENLQLNAVAKFSIPIGKETFGQFGPFVNQVQP